MTAYEQFRATLALNPIAIPDATPYPQVGQVWRAAWTEAVSNVYIVATTPDTVTALPVTGDPEIVSNPYCLLDVAESPLGYAAAIWRSPHVEVPTFVLDGCYGEIPGIHEELVDLSTPLSERARAADPSWQMQQRLSETMLCLKEATWLPESQPVGPLRTLMQRAQVSARTLSERMAATEGTLRLIVDGSWWIGDDAIALLADALAVPAADLPHGDPFAAAPELPRAVNSPARKRAFQQRAERDGVAEAKARFDAVQQLLPALTRQAGRDINERAKWDQLLDVYLSDE